MGKVQSNFPAIHKLCNITIGDRFGRTLVFGFRNCSGDGETFGGFEFRVRIGGHVTFVADAMRSKFVTSDTGVWMIWINPITRGPVGAYALPLAGLTTMFELGSTGFRLVLG